MENKIERAKEWGHWFLNQDGTCKSHIPVINPRGEYDKSCETALHSLESSILGTELHKSVIDILSLVDHAFILSVERCKKFYVPVQLRGKLTCVVGREIDSCVFGKRELAYVDYSERAGFSHAYAHLYAKRHGLKTIAVLEEDFFVSRDIHPSHLSHMQNLLQTELWTFVRIGRRPYFLEGLLHPDKCPLQCECKLVAEFGLDLCHMQYSSCDMRSTEFYIASQRVFSRFAELVHDAGKYPWQPADGRDSPAIRTRYPIIDVDVVPSFENQWYILPQLSFQVNLRDIDQTVNRQLEKSSVIFHQEHTDSRFQQSCVS